MKLVGVEFHQSGGNRQFRKAQLHGVNRRSCYPQVNQAETANSERIRTWIFLLLTLLIHQGARE